ncbi:hypothetical protein DPMN_189223 [Dreissena polymorpha]|uniref:Uncharacterized protein n=1 Tax=Dreissena polymorpha TaxID=45954 RepID=A0A9D4DRK9_DREPO|nr:hypothetical protein DPMN_189223 [Dreissena polymorpha]
MEALQINVCSVFKDVDECKAGFRCNRESVDIKCSHVCLKEAKCGANGVCYFDEIVNDTMCR